MALVDEIEVNVYVYRVLIIIFSVMIIFIGARPMIITMVIVRSIQKYLSYKDLLVSILMSMSQV